MVCVLGASPVPDRRRVPPDMYDRYGGPPPHVMHHPREFRPPMHHESGKIHETHQFHFSQSILVTR